MSACLFKASTKRKSAIICQETFFPLSVHFFKVIKMTLQCLKLKWRSERFYGKVWSIFNLISLKCRSRGSEKWLRFYLFFTMSRRIALKKQRREEPSVLFLFSVLS